MFLLRNVLKYGSEGFPDNFFLEVFPRDEEYRRDSPDIAIAVKSPRIQLLGDTHDHNSNVPQSVRHFEVDLNAPDIVDALAQVLGILQMLLDVVMDLHLNVM